MGRRVPENPIYYYYPILGSIPPGWMHLEQGFSSFSLKLSPYLMIFQSGGVWRCVSKYHQISGKNLWRKWRKSLFKMGSQFISRILGSPITNNNVFYNNILIENLYILITYNSCTTCEWNCNTYTWSIFSPLQFSEPRGQGEKNSNSSWKFAPWAKVPEEASGIVVHPSGCD